jgi:CSLREA domain-containing protein
MRFRGFVPIVATIVFAVLAAPASGAIVTKTADTNDGVCDADCSLREAIVVAGPGETVTVPASVTPYVVSDTFGTLLIDKSITVAGAGARFTEVTGPGTLVTSPRPFTIQSTALTIPTVTIRDLSITGGNGAGGVQFGEGGGVLAIQPAGAIGPPKLTLDRVRVANNTATVTSNAQAVGGGVASDQPGTQIVIRDSLIANNQAIGTGDSQATGGGVATFANGTMVIENTMIVGNQAVADGISGQSGLAGGAFLQSASSLLNVTLSGNSAVKSIGGTFDGRVGNLTASGSVSVRNTIVTAGVADDAATADCGEVNSQGGNVMPPACAPGPADRTATNAMLGPLADNGGPTDTLALLAGSPAIDAGIGCPPPIADQRGVTRPQGPACDSGAFEVVVPTSPASPPALKCQGKTATVVGTAGADSLKGTKKADVIAALGGKDRISALAGNDRVCGGAGNDSVSGGKGNDRLNGEKGRDRLLGGPGKDSLKGGTGRDTLIGGADADKLAGGPGKDTQLQ